MKRALTVVAIATGFVGLAAAPASAAELAAPKPVVTYQVWEDGAAVGTSIPGQPLLGARADVGDGTACAGFSYQVPQCAEVTPIEIATG